MRAIIGSRLAPCKLTGIHQKAEFVWLCTFQSQKHYSTTTQNRNMHCETVTHSIERGGNFDSESFILCPFIIHSQKQLYCKTNYSAMSIVDQVKEKVSWCIPTARSYYVCPSLLPLVTAVQQLHSQYPGQYS